MTQMQTPYGASDVNLYQEPERTSVMAILSMIFGIVGCCGGITSIPAIFLGIFSLFGISKSKGRVGGTGFGIAGILVGLLTLALWGGLVGVSVFGMQTMITTFGSSTEQVFTDIQAGDYQSARNQLNSPAADSTDEQFAIFYESYQGSLGDYASLPTGFFDMLEGYMAVGEQIQPYNGRPGYVPFPVRFDSGWALVIIVMDTQSGSGSIDAQELIVVDSQGNEYRLPGADAGSMLDTIDESIDEVVDDAEEAVDDLLNDEPATDDGP